MDYVTRQFINLTKKFRKDSRKALTELLRVLQQQTEAIRKTNKRQDTEHEPQQPPITVRAELYVPENVEKDRRTHENRQHSLQIWVVIGTWAAFLAASGYAYVAIRQWREMIAVRHQAQYAIDKTIEGIDLARTNAHLDQRAWLSIAMQATDAIVGQPLTIEGYSSNSGRTYATNARVCVIKAVSPNEKQLLPPQSPRFKECRDADWKPPGIIAPNSGNLFAVDQVTSAGQTGLDKTSAEWLNSNKEIVWVYGKVTYDDIFGCHHWLTYCFYRASTAKINATQFGPPHFITCNNRSPEVDHECQ
jgi:hypothetical protein